MIEELVAACEWFANPYLLFSGNVFSNLIYYSHLTPIIVSLALGAFVYFADRKSLIKKTLFLITLILGMWLLLDLVLWATDSIQIVMFAWSIINMLEPVIYAGFTYLIYIFILGKDINWKLKMLLVLPTLPTILGTATGWNVLGFNLTDCDREVIEGPLAFYNYAIEIGYSFWIFCLGIWAWFRPTTPAQKRQITLVVGATLILLLGFASGNIVGSFSEDWTIGQYGLFVLPISVGTLAYFIVQFRFLAQSQLAGIQLLIIGLWLAVGSVLFIQSLEYARWIVGATLVFLTLIGYLLVKSIRTEIEQRKQIEKLAADLKVSNEQLSELMSFATHEIRNPATAIKGISSLGLEGTYGQLPPTILDAFQKMFIRANDIIHLGNQYLDKSKAELNQLVYSFEDFSLGNMAEALVNEFQPAATQRTITLTANIDKAQDTTVCADQGKIKEVLGNLIDNAIKYTPANGSATVSVSKGNATVTVKVSDTGPGIPAETIPKLFKKFSRADAKQANLLGTGLGLYLSKMFVDAHHGRIWVESEGKDKGSTFFVELPIKQEKREAAPTPVPPTVS